MNKPQQADFLLNHPLVQEFFAQLHKQVYAGVKKAKTAESREELAAFGRYADEFEQFFRAYIQTGQMEDLQARETERIQAVEKARMDRVASLYNY